MTMVPSGPPIMKWKAPSRFRPASPLPRPGTAFSSTPLNAVIGFSELLEQEIFGGLNDKQRTYVSNVLVSGRPAHLGTARAEVTGLESMRRNSLLQDTKSP